MDAAPFDRNYSIAQSFWRTLSRVAAPTRVLHVFSSAAGGASLSTIALIRGSRLHGIESSAVCAPIGTQDEIQNLEDAVDGRLLIIPLWWWNKKIRMRWWKRPAAHTLATLRTGCSLASTTRIASFARSHNVELLHTNTLVTTEGATASKAMRLPHVWHAREMVGPGGPFRFPFEQVTLPALLHYGCDAIIANSTATAKALPSLIQNKTYVIPNGIDTDDFSPASQRTSQHTLTIAMVGNLTTRWKKHQLALEAFALISEDFPHAQLHFFGHLPQSEDPYVAQIKQRAIDLGLGQRVFFRGFVDSPSEVMKQVDILVHPADGESFGRILVEAMATTVPVVSVAGGGAPTIIDHGQTGFLARVDDVAEMALYLARLASDPHLRASMGLRGRAVAETRFSLASHVERTVEVYSDAVKSHMSKSRRTLPRPRP